VTRGALFLAVLFACMSTGVAGAAQGPVLARGPVSGLAADGNDVAFMTVPTVVDCDKAYIWQRPAQRTFQLGKKQQCAGPRGVAGVAVTGGRALWLTWLDAKVRIWRLFTATTTKRTPRRLQLVSTDPGAPQPIVVGAAGGGLLPFAVGSTVTTLRANGTKAFTWTAPARVVALAARAGRVAVATEGARVTVLDVQGNVVSVDLYESEVSSVALTAKGQLVQRGTTLELRRGADTHQYAVTAGAQLDDADARWAAWSDGKLVHLIRLPDGAQTAAYPGSWAALAGTLLYVANGRKITLRTIH
jgi:hypothetical protein